MISSGNTSDETRTNRPARRRLRRVVSVGWKILLGVALLAVLAHGIASLVIGRQLEGNLRDLRSSGDLPRLADLNGPAVPDSENAAMSLEPAATVLRRADYARDDDAVALADPRGKPNDPQALLAAREVLTRRAGLLAIVDEAVRKPNYRPDVDYRQGFYTPLPHLGDLRKLARLVSADAIVHAADGDSAASLRSLTTGVRLAELLRDEPSLVGQLVRLAVLDQSLSALREVLPHVNTDTPEGAALMEELQGIELESSIVKGLKTERAIAVDTFRQVHRNPLLAVADDGGPRRETLWTRTLGLAWRPFSYADELVYLDTIDRAIRNSDRRYPQVDWSSEDRPLPRYASTTKYVLPRVDACQYERYGVTARLDLALAALALRTHRLRNGIYPASLADVGDADRSTPRVQIQYSANGSGFRLESAAAKVQPPANSDAVPEEFIWEFDR